jgi:hypothetical protein
MRKIKIGDKIMIGLEYWEIVEILKKVVAVKLRSNIVWWSKLSLQQLFNIQDELPPKKL